MSWKGSKQSATTNSKDVCWTRTRTNIGGWCVFLQYEACCVLDHRTAKERVGFLQSFARAWLWHQFGPANKPSP